MKKIGCSLDFAGQILKDKHCINSVISYLFSRTDTGYFDYLKIEYNCLFDV